jgi:hypothetical protein
MNENTLIVKAQCIKTLSYYHLDQNDQCQPADKSE